MKRKYIYLIIIVGIIAFVAYKFSSEKGGKIAPPSESPKGAPIEVNGIVVSPKDFENILTVSGSVEPNEQVQIRSEVSGIIRNLYFHEGSFVTKGQILFNIDDTELQAQLLQRQTEEKLAEENARRASLLLEKEAISTQEKDVALADLQSAQAQTQLIKAQIAKTKVRAPFSGKIGLRSVSAGEYLTPTTIVANLMSTNPVKILFSVPEKYTAQIKEGLPLNFTISGSSKQYGAKIYAIEPGIDAQTRTIQIRALAANDSGELFPGSFARVQLPINMVKEAVLIPTEAVIPVQGGKQVFVCKGGKASAVDIESDSRTSTDILVNKGISIGDTVLTSGVMALKNGMNVHVNLKN
ncbi:MULTISPECIES: efflux RND transporter periplasmic adaptor subunit [Olivibacter]|jgi:membrane fusion protein (multidrug efflux system)|uniref:Efflux RND transporter periplasmic adaptor subunit n=2 Tax=Olivibacter TaxID=376469 RepID=A0ABV6HQU1_9SPHI|nr:MULTISPECIES: efflux RND transporter periplasmic adaptor subunit [Olivibacter]MCL4637895.1 efflux RND transporter periplasmic adaptor subunit [Olivibacter sp. UJ_SKK_5.1]MDM8173995.1 efflux RND transporter periplasmic adaptor subunit [Olivibacter sp. 47]MDX3917023.1 efflux RND transporter periplasmic adaptor subunit [Pseudosphingobacterium sp.]QEL03780.1 efflux RND transporter periplasmic adaptor subunit [Olivibacter sp. LS-1]